jgi:hypothetical protein
LLKPKSVDQTNRNRKFGGENRMRVNRCFKIAALITSFLLAGCASFEPALRTPDLTRSRQPSAVTAQEGLEISVEEFASPNKSRQAFDADIASSGILALLVRADNKGTVNYKITQGSVTAHLDGQSLPSIGGTAAANQAATSEYAGKALGWTIATGPFAILLWPVTIAGSAAHTQSVNRRIQQHFESLQFTDALLKPNQVATGFVYFELPENLTKLEKLSIGATASEEPGGKQLSFNLSLPEIALQQE